MNMELVKNTTLLGLMYIPIVFIINMIMKLYYFKSIVSPRLEISTYLSIVITSLVVLIGIVILCYWLGRSLDGFLGEILTYSGAFGIPVLVSWIILKDHYKEIKQRKPTNQ